MNNKGFTLVEVVISLVVGSLVCLSIFVLVQLCVRQQLLSDTASTLQIECNNVEQNLRGVIQSCSKYESFVKDDKVILEIYSYNLRFKKNVYYVYLLYDNKLYLRLSSSSYKPEDIIVNIDDFELLSNCCSNILLNPVGYNIDDNSDFNGDVCVKLNLLFNDKTYEASFVEHIKGVSK